jgi:hypothetical protein
MMIQKRRFSERIQLAARAGFFAILFFGVVPVAHPAVIYSGIKDITIGWPYIYSFDINGDHNGDFFIKTDLGGNGSPPPGATSGEWLVSGFHPSLGLNARVLRAPGSSWEFSAALDYGFSISQTAPAPLYWQAFDAPIWNGWGNYFPPNFEAANGPWWGYPENISGWNSKLIRKLITDGRNLVLQRRGF